MNNLDYEKAVRLEREAYANVKRLAAELAVACRPIAHQGDGNCGAVIDYVLQALSDQGLYGAMPRHTPRYKKAPISPGLRTQVFERDEYRCKHCGTHKNLRADHIYPESKGGATTLENLQTLCHSCNSIKGAKL